MDYKNKASVPWSRGCGLNLKLGDFDKCMEAIANQPRFANISLSEIALSEEEYPRCDKHQAKLKLACSKDGRPLMSCGISQPNHECGAFYWLDGASKSTPFEGERSTDYMWLVQHYPDLQQVVTQYIDDHLDHLADEKKKKKKVELGRKRPAVVIPDEDDDADSFLEADRQEDEDLDDLQQLTQDKFPNDNRSAYREVHAKTPKRSGNKQRKPCK